MPALQVRDFPQPLYDRLKEQAARDHRSMAQQALFYIEGGLNGSHKPNGTTTTTSEQERSIYTPHIDTNEDTQARIKRRKTLFEKINASPFTLPPNAPSPAEMLHQARDERDTQMEEVLASLTPLNAQGGMR